MLFNELRLTSLEGVTFVAKMFLRDLPLYAPKMHLLSLANCWPLAINGQSCFELTVDR